MEPLKPNDQRARTAVTLIWLVCTMEIASFISSFAEYLLINSLINGEAGGLGISEAVIEANDQRELIISGIYLLVYIISAVTFIMWFRRAYANLHLRCDYLSQSEGMAAGIWFIPYLNLYRPYRMMQELYFETQNLLQHHKLISEEALSTRFLGWWWGLWIFNNIYANVVSRIERLAEEPDTLELVSILNMAGNVVGIILCFVTVKVIKDYAIHEGLLQEIKEEETLEIATEASPEAH